MSRRAGASLKKNYANNRNTAECIGAMTGDTTVYAANMAGNIREGYGPDALTAKS